MSELEPEIVEAVQQQEALVRVAETQSQALAVVCQVDYDRAGEAMVDLGKMAANIEAARKEQVAPHNARVARINAAYKSITERLNGVVVRYGDLRRNWKNEQDRIRAEAEKAAQEAARKEQKRLDDLALERAKRAEAKGDVQKAEEILASVPQVVPAPVVSVAPVVKTAGIATKTYWFVEVRSLRDLVTAAASGEIDLAAVLADDSWLKKNCQALRKHPFLKVWSEERDVRTGR
jgi:hypothetical protein